MQKWYGMNEYEEELEKIAPTKEQKIISALKTKVFPLVLVWLWSKFNDKKEEFVYGEELADFLGIRRATAYEYLNHFCRLGLLYKNITSGKLVVEFRPTKDGDELELKKWVDKAWEELRKRKIMK